MQITFSLYNQRNKGFKDFKGSVYQDFRVGIFQNVITVNLNCDRHPYLFLFIQLCILIKKLIQMVYKKTAYNQ